MTLVKELVVTYYISSAMPRLVAQMAISVLIFCGPSGNGVSELSELKLAPKVGAVALVSNFFLADAPLATCVTLIDRVYFEGIEKIRSFHHP